jgi:hypothetical protein
VRGIVFTWLKLYSPFDCLCGRRPRASWYSGKVLLPTSLPDIVFDLAVLNLGAWSETSRKDASNCRAALGGVEDPNASALLPLIPFAFLQVLPLASKYIFYKCISIPVFYSLSFPFFYSPSFLLFYVSQPRRLFIITYFDHGFLRLQSSPPQAHKHKIMP